MSTLHVDVVSAEKNLYSGEAAMVVLPGEAGSLGIYPRHTPLITRIAAGLVHIKKTDGSEETIFVAGGILEVQPNVVTVLADTAQRSDELDEAKANEARARAMEAKANAKTKEDLHVIEAELAMLAAQIASIRKLRGK